MTNAKTIIYPPKCRFSLIIATLNREKELSICLDSLLNQSFQDFEIIIIDQSDNSQTEILAEQERYEEMNIIYKKVGFRGLSKARNFGLTLMHGQYFCLIDDDAKYCRDYLRIADELLKEHKKTILSGYLWNPITESALPGSKNTKGFLSIRQIIRICPSPTLIFPGRLIEDGFLFDEKLGVGGSFGACEETDLILRAASYGYKVFYSGNLQIIHPTMTHSFEIENKTEIQKIENYARGLGALLKKDLIIEKNLRLLPTLIEKAIKISIKSIGVLGSEKKVCAQAEWRGIIAGMREYCT